jgi:hypothetical protein
VGACRDCFSSSTSALSACNWLTQLSLWVQWVL